MINMIRALILAVALLGSNSINAYELAVVPPPHQEDHVETPVNPIWIMLAMGGGMAAGTISFAFWHDFAAAHAQESAENDPARRDALRAAVVGDAVIGSALVVAAAAGIVTGAALLIYSALEEVE